MVDDFDTKYVSMYFNRDHKHKYLHPYYLILTLGTSGEYLGDSQINVMGDLVSCALGYNTARYLSIELGSTILPSIIFLLIEFILAIVIRDNMTLMAVQIFIPQKS